MAIASGVITPGLRLDRGTVCYRYGPSFEITPSPGPNELARIYLRFEEQGVLPFAFSKGVPDLAEFLARYEKLPILACRLNRNLCGLGWVNWMSQPDRHGEVGTAFVRGLPPTVTTLFSQMMLDWVFREVKLDTIYATTPDRNRAAVRHLLRTGFDLHGPIPRYSAWRGERADCWIGSLTREQWDERQVF